MALDPVTMLVLSLALAASAALHLAIEWRSVRAPALLFWSAGFATIFLGCGLSLLRTSGILILGIWFANGLLIFAHWLFLFGVARFTDTRLSRGWYLIVPFWVALLLLPEGPQWSKTMLLVNSLLVAALALRASLLLQPHGRSLSVGAVQLRFVLLLHGLFYLLKGLSVFLPGTLLDLAALRGQIIQISLVEGVMAIMLIAVSMTGSERHRREKQMAHLAARDPLTALYNRRAFEVRAAALLDEVSVVTPGALLLIDVDNFKPVNDLHGHTAGDHLLVTLSEQIRSLLPEEALAARLGGDEFAILLKHASRERVESIGNALREQFNAVTSASFSTPQPVTLSIGASLFDQPPGSLAVLIEQVDEALYQSKRGGRDTLQLVDRTRLGVASRQPV